MKQSLSYRSAGVDIDAGNDLVALIKNDVKRTFQNGVLGALGGFGGMFELPSGYKNPVLVSGTDGVGTKLKLAQQLNMHHSIGIDLVAMCVNDILVLGAKPLYFLDYYASGKLNLSTASAVVKGIADGCIMANAALLGGETAEMPGMYSGEDYDLAGFCVGIVEKEQIIDSSNVTAGDALVALGSSGFHSNGYSLLRKIIEVNQVDLNTKFANTTLGAALLQPTTIYVDSIHSLLEQFSIKAMSHITGGGLLENLPRVLPDNLSALIKRDSWQLPPIFSWAQKMGNIEEMEMLRTFNCGIGMVLVVEQKQATAVVEAANALGENAFIVGELFENKRQAGHKSAVILK